MIYNFNKFTDNMCKFFLNNICFLYYGFYLGTINNFINFVS